MEIMTENNIPIIQEDCPVTTSKRLLDDIKTLDLSNDKELIKETLRDAFVAARLESSTQAQILRAKALESLYEKIDGMEVNKLVQVIESLSRIGEPDLAAVTGVSADGKAVGGTTVNNNILTSSPNTSSEHRESQVNAKFAGNVLESASIIIKSLEGNSMKDITPK